ncbi:VTC domain-containing protein [Streptomyces thioluteus]|uniref:VTC domain-containing protein n=1 Tax=Streptomyces thioluteus TaxID=66431 RepID=UPI0031E7FFC1
MSAPAVEAVTEAAGAAAPVSLAEVDERAGLLVRFDRSYLVPVDAFLRIAECLTGPRRPDGPFRALAIGGRRAFRYHSVYYDTPGLRSFHDHRQGRRLRFKVRERVYEDSGERQFEIKLKGGPRQHRQAPPPDGRCGQPAGRRAPGIPRRDPAACLRHRGARRAGPLPQHRLPARDAGRRRRTCHVRRGAVLCRPGHRPHRAL